jgi:hypothetical protein
MLLVVCFRLDFPVDADSVTVRFAHDRLEGLVSLLERNRSALVNLAISSAALAGLQREGFDEVLTRTRALAYDRRIELMGTAAHGALLPLLPEKEIERQLALNSEANRVCFGDLYRPETLWPPELACSSKLAQVAEAEGYSSVLVDESAMRVWPAAWQWDRVDALAGRPGFFAIPSSRAASARLQQGAITTRRELESFVPAVETALDERYLVATVELMETIEPSVVPDSALRRARSMRIADLFTEVALDRTTNLLPSSRRSTQEEVANGLPFASWFTPGIDRHALQWRLLMRVIELLEQVEHQGYAAAAAVHRLRATLDVVERESWWREGGDGARRLQDCLAGFVGMGVELQIREVAGLCEALGGGAVSMPTRAAVAVPS